MIDAAAHGGDHRATDRLALVLPGRNRGSTGPGDDSRPSLRKFMEILVREVDLGVVDLFITIVLEASKLM